MARFFSGFFLGSLVTTLGCYYYYVNTIQKKKKDENEDEQDDSTNHHDKNTPPSFLAQSLSASIASTLTTHTKDSSRIRTGFLSDVIGELWSHITLAGGEMISDMVKPMLPSSIKLIQCDLGKNPLQMDNIHVHDISPDGSCVQFNLDIKWDGACNIQINAPVVGNFGISKLQFYGRMQIIFKPLTDSIPCIDAIQYTFVNQPHIQLQFTGIATVADVSYIKEQIHTAILDVLSSMLVLPYRMMYKMVDESNYNFFKTYHPPLGIARITLLSGRGFEIEKKGPLQKDDIPDVYCCITLDGSIRSSRKKSCRTYQSKTIKNHLEPVWCEATANNDQAFDAGYMVDFVVFDVDQVLKVVAWDEDSSPFDPDDFLGDCQVTIGELLLACRNSTSGNSTELPLLVNHKPVGAHLTLRCELFPLTSNADESTVSSGGANNTSEEEPSKAPPQGELQQEQTGNEFCIIGMLTIIVAQIRHVQVISKKKYDPNNSTAIAASSSIFVRVKYGNQEFSTYPVVPPTDENDEEKDDTVLFHPAYDTVFHVPLNPQIVHNKDISFEIVNTAPTSDETDTSKQEVKEQVLGSVLVAQKDLWKGNLTTMTTDATITDQREFGSTGASLEFSIRLQGVDHTTTATKKDSDAISVVNNDVNNTSDVAASTDKIRGMDDDPVSTTTKASSPTLVTQQQQEQQLQPKLRKNKPSSPLSSSMSNKFLNKQVSITILRGHGYPIEKKRFPQKDDIPDCYCIFQYGSSPQGKWKTSTIRNSCDPVWNETSPVSYKMDNMNTIISIEVWDEDKSTVFHDDPDDFLGRVSFTIGQLLGQEKEKEEVVLELRDEHNHKNGCSLVLSCRVEP